MGLENYRRSVSASKHASILRAGRDVFLRDGYSRASVSDIARDAEVSTATLYKHFRSKEELFDAVLKEAYVTIEYEDMAEDENVEDVIVAYCMRSLRTQFERRTSALLRVVIAEVATAPERARHLYENFITPRHIASTQALDELIARGKLKPHDTHYGACFLGGVMKEYFIWPTLFEANMTLPDNAETVVRQAVKVYLELYGTCPSDKN
ncbi:TetR family transcriptional regulator [Parvibaculum sedimenti]|uniref:TetR family transcriptional regulator n=1 Tax=Parvibaculum sedimenti TaxID=2608632 RepID=A0A6N6VHF9_9HYPH|nr:TetR/AcrR family transcriptional regulator [Parvibaculum sedimenti]KAB7739408.1 TetR family transcriptional regulator [Parvibaculum sedimenti]